MEKMEKYAIDFLFDCLITRVEKCSVGDGFTLPVLSRTTRNRGKTITTLQEADETN